METHLTGHLFVGQMDKNHVSRHHLSGILLDLVTSILTLLILTRDKETFISTRFLLASFAISIVAYIFATFIIGVCTLAELKTSLFCK